VIGLTNNSCDDLFVLGSNINPSCDFDVIENWFKKLLGKVEMANTTERLICIREIAKKVRDKCRNTEGTKEFINDAYNQVVSYANEKISRIKTIQPQNTLVSFSSGRRKSAFGTIETKIKEEKENKLKNLWI
jgi:hypothetical protein